VRAKNQAHTKPVSPDDVLNNLSEDNVPNTGAARTNPDPVGTNQPDESLISLDNDFLTNMFGDPVISSPDASPCPEDKTLIDLN
jgi:hypothetical protein